MTTATTPVPVWAGHKGLGQRGLLGLCLMVHQMG